MLMGCIPARKQLGATGLKYLLFLVLHVTAVALAGHGIAVECKVKRSKAEMALQWCSIAMDLAPEAAPGLHIAMQGSNKLDTETRPTHSTKSLTSS